MKQLSKYNEEYFNRFSTDPVKVIPFDPKVKKLAQEYMHIMDQVLSKWKIKSELIGSTALEIAGKGEIEIGLYLEDKNWDEVKTFLSKHLGGIGSDGSEYARFNDSHRGAEVEIILTKGHTSKV